MKTKRLFLVLIVFVGIVFTSRWWLPEVLKLLSVNGDLIQALDSAIGLISNIFTVVSALGGYILLRDQQNDNKTETLEQRNRRILLGHVENFWVKGVLEKSLHGMTLLELGVKENPEAVKTYPWAIKKEETNETLPTGTSMLQIFDSIGMGRSLLILGAPGSGKTTMLLELARQLIERARHDVDEPIPIVFNLASWTEKLSLSDWLAQELNTIYSVPIKIAPDWVKGNKLLLLLDGLDEVRQESHAKCIEVINEFRREHGMTSLTVCSRSQDYANIKERLFFDGAIIIQPLTQNQVAEFLNNFGREVEGVKLALERDNALREMAETPLFLSIMILTYKDKLASEISLFKDENTQRKILLSAYIDRMFDSPRSQRKKYNKQDTLRWISWLADRMVSHNTIPYWYEDMRVYWLDDIRLLLTHTFLNLVIMPGFIVGWFSGFIFSFFTNIIFGLFFVPIASFITGFLILGFMVFNTLLSIKINSYAVLGAINGLCSGLLLIISAIVLEDIPININFFLNPFIWLILSLPSAIGYIVGWVITLYIGKASSEKVFNAFRFEFAIYESFTLVLNKDALPALVLITFLLYIVSGSLWTVLIGISLGSLVGITKKYKMGIQLDRRKIDLALRDAFFASFLTVVLLGIAFFAFNHLAGDVISKQNNIFAKVLIFAWLYSFISNSMGAISHLMLRLLMFIGNFLPWKIESFLDHCVDLVFLRRVGNGYIFVHRLLMEHFANMSTTNRPNVVSIGYYNYEKREYQKALNNFDWAIQKNPLDKFAFALRSKTYFEMKNYTLALSDIRKAIEINPEDTFLLENRGDMYSQLGEYDFAIDDYTKIIKILPDEFRILAIRGLTYFEAGKYDLAIIDLDQYLKIKPGHINFIFFRGVSKMKLKDFSGALFDFDEAYKLAKKSKNNSLELMWVIQLQRGITYLLMGRYKEALAEFEAQVKKGRYGKLNSLHFEAARTYFYRSLAQKLLRQDNLFLSDINRCMVLGKPINEVRTEDFFEVFLYVIYNIFANDHGQVYSYYLKSISLNPNISQLREAISALEDIIELFPDMETFHKLYENVNAEIYKNIEKLETNKI